MEIENKIHEKFRIFGQNLLVTKILIDITFGVMLKVKDF